MGLPLDQLGKTRDERIEVVDPDRAKAYAAATNDDNPAYTSGQYAPPVFAVVPTWEAMSSAAGEVVPAEHLAMIVHGEQDMHFAQPLVPGMKLRTVAQPFSYRVGGTGTRCTIRVDATTDSGEPVLTEYVTLFVRGLSEGESGGPDKPDHRFPAEAREKLIGELSIHVDDDQTYRYKEASGDPMPIHVDDDFAKAVGLPGIIAHGLCTMAMCSQAVIKLAADGDPARLRRLAVRFSNNVFPGSDVVTTLHDAGVTDEGRKSVAFEARSGGQIVIKNGRAEIDPA